MLAPKSNDEPDHPPKELNIGAINPFALVEALMGRKFSWNEVEALRLLSSVLQTDYVELFDLRFTSLLYAGVRLNEHGGKAELIPAKDMHTLTERDLVTPDFSHVEKLGDLRDMGIKDLDAVRIKHAVMSNGNLRLTLEPQKLGKTLSNSEMTTTLRELCTPFRVKEKEPWTPPNGSWVDLSEWFHHDATKFSDPVQGATANSSFVAALMSVFWSDPAVIKHTRGRRHRASNDHFWDTGSDSGDASTCKLTVTFHSKGGAKDAPTSTVTVGCDLPINNASSLPMYCRPSSLYNLRDPARLGGDATWAGELWPALYEKAYAKWLMGDEKDDDDSLHRAHPDLTQTAHGDPVKTMCQLTDRDPQYFFTEKRRGSDLLGLVRAHSVNLRAIYPMVAWTHPSHGDFRGCTLVGNMAYSVLGWAAPQERKRYIILRHPWGTVEPEGVTSYPGVVNYVDAQFWPPVDFVDEWAVFAIEADAFKEYFAGIGVAK
ncbi:hypothetical protein C8A03DRAFT_36340 [Achaetomium macrosporum]|uniref:Calpain catalytic domain-containing protein n=1 Tax=Achaetomium macrosporum TaxID=79813 RepID=A0AAN7H9W3_9PEZI|nr:hypothetical protein C8A03DRAFT_36340 [Achaetomium macrosporum]